MAVVRSACAVLVMVGIKAMVLLAAGLVIFSLRELAKVIV